MNLSIVVPGRCNAACSFCFWINRKMCDRTAYFNGLVKALQDEEITTISLTGGEPTISEVFPDVLVDVLDNKGARPVVLTTNGSELKRYLEDIDSVVDHVNISRHRIDDKLNREVFRSKAVPGTGELAELCTSLNEQGIDVTLAAVLIDGAETSEKCWLLDYIQFAKDVGASSVTFREQHSELLKEMTTAQEEMIGWRTIAESRCPICYSRTKLICGIPVRFKHSTMEPSKDLGEVWEKVYQPCGELTADWKGEQVLWSAVGGGTKEEEQMETRTEQMLGEILERLDRLEKGQKKTKKEAEKPPVASEGSAVGGSCHSGTGGRC